MSELGYDIEDIDREIAEDKDRARKLGLHFGNEKGGNDEIFRN